MNLAPGLGGSMSAGMVAGGSPVAHAAKRGHRKHGHAMHGPPHKRHGAKKHAGKSVSKRKGY
jgi:hypothetical protein